MISFSSNDSRKSARAQTYTMRSYVYFVLVRSWGAGLSTSGERPAPTIQEFSNSV
ncbi:MAG: hypothetical protein ABIN89_00425 [Chitinophagaceae bacterium]